MLLPHWFNLTIHIFAAGLGLEPRLTVPETVVLPLDDPAMLCIIHKNTGLSIYVCYYFLVKKLTIVTWNVGFGGMGAEAEMAMDGGSRIIPSSARSVIKNIRGIQKIIRKQEADVFLLQEISHGSLLNHWYDIERRIRKVLQGFEGKFIPNFRVPLLPFQFLRNEHGLGTFVHPDHTVTKTESYAYKKSETYYGFVRRHDYLLATFLEPKNGGPIVIINTHLASFDEGGAIRTKQCEEVLAYAKELYETGHNVVIGADWNMLLQDKFIDEAAKDRYAKALCKFPVESLPDGWTMQCCETHPTVRAASTPYCKNSSVTASIDGFVCSPGVTVESVRTLNYNFQWSDHNPVELVVSY